MYRHVANWQVTGLSALDGTEPHSNEHYQNIVILSGFKFYSSRLVSLLQSNELVYKNFVCVSCFFLFQKLFLRMLRMDYIWLPSGRWLEGQPFYRHVCWNWTVLFCNVTQRRVVSPFRRFGTTCGSYLQGPSWTSWPYKTEPIGSPETSVRNYHSTLRNIPEERRSHIHRGESLNSHIGPTLDMLSYPIFCFLTTSNTNACFIDAVISLSIWSGRWSAVSTLILPLWTRIRRHWTLILLIWALIASRTLIRTLNTNAPLLKLVFCTA